MEQSEDYFYYSTANKIKIGDLLLIAEYPCKIVERTESKTGKHGGCKIHFCGIDIFTKNKHVIIHGSDKKVRVPNIVRTEYQLVDINDEESDAYLVLMNSMGQIREDIKLPEDEIGLAIREQFDDDEELIVAVLLYRDSALVTSFK